MLLQLQSGLLSQMVLHLMYEEPFVMINLIVVVLFKVVYLRVIDNRVSISQVNSVSLVVSGLMSYRIFLHRLQKRGNQSSIFVKVWMFCINISQLNRNQIFNLQQIVTVQHLCIFLSLANIKTIYFRVSLYQED